MSKTQSLLERLVTFDSSNLETANETIEFCKQWLENEGVESKVLLNNGYKMLLATVGNGDKRLILNGHVDVVSGKPDQFKPEVKNDKLFGRGAADMKGGVAAFMVAITELQNKDLGNTSVQLQLVTDEEIGGNNCSSFLTENGHLGDFVICGEPTQIGIGFQAKGILQIDIHLTGKSAHGSRPWEGENAIVKALKLYNDILKLPFAQESTDIYKSPSINLAKISGGDVYNKVPDECTVSYDIRYLPTQDKEDILNQIKGVTDGEVSVHLSGAGVTNDVKSNYMQKLIQQIKDVTHEEKVEIFGQHGYADTRYFAQHGVPAIEFGPSGGEWHGDGEYAVISSLDVYKDIIIKFAENFS